MKPIENKNHQHPLSVFIERLMAEKGLNTLPEDAQREIRQDLLTMAEDRVNAAILQNLPPEKLEEFEKLVDQGNEDQIQSFTSENIPDLEAVIAAELVKFKDTYLK